MGEQETEQKQGFTIRVERGSLYETVYFYAATVAEVNSRIDDLKKGDPYFWDSSRLEMVVGDIQIDGQTFDGVIGKKRSVGTDDHGKTVFEDVPAGEGEKEDADHPGKIKVMVSRLADICDGYEVELLGKFDPEKLYYSVSNNDSNDILALEYDGESVLDGSCFDRLGFDGEADIEVDYTDPATSQKVSDII